MDAALLAPVCRLWRLRLARLRPELAASGSPDRSLARAVIEDEAGRLLLVERLAAEAAPHKLRIAATLAALAAGGLSVAHPYLADGSGQYVLTMRGSYWQISPYLAGEPLPRPDWVCEAWRGRALADFLIALRRVSVNLSLPAGEPFRMGAFVAELYERIARLRPALAGELAPIAGPLLAHWLPPDESLAYAFCHGDPHPLNVIWQGQAMLAVIDWEFFGPKPALYDLALIIGCVGSEEPSALTGPLVRALLARLRASGGSILDDGALWPLVLAIRFAWLSDWLRRGDEEMVDLEMAYLRLLMERREELMATWAGR
jgi:homoserine kinase type II